MKTWSLYKRFLVLMVPLWLLLMLAFVGVTNGSGLQGLLAPLLLEICVVSALLLWLILGNKLLRYLAYGLFCAFIGLLVLQCLSLYFGGRYISHVALDNANHISLLITPLRVLMILFAVVILLLALCWVERGRVISQGLVRWLGPVVLLGIGGLVTPLLEWLPERQDKAQAALNSNAYGPMQALYRVLGRREFYSGLTFSAEEQAELEALGYRFDYLADYPLLKPKVYDAPAPFVDAANKSDRPNVLIFFVEGLAARTTSVYTDGFPELTPNMARFAQTGMVVRNYLNHAFATYRGLAGQLCSIYPLKGGGEDWQAQRQRQGQTRYFCLPHIMQQQGYHSEFIDTHRRDAGYVDELASEIGFAEVQVAETLSPSFLGGAEPARHDALSDQQLFDALIGRLRSLESTGESSAQPFFMAMYNLGTHAFQAAAKDGVRYRLKDNPVLHNIHNYDAAFGRFLDYWQQSPLRHNTVVVLTSDHSHYHERDYVKLFSNKGDFQSAVVDEIPLIIQHPTQALPAQWQPTTAVNSLSFAPSLLHLLGQYNGPNHFLGRSIFEPQSAQLNQANILLAAAGNDMYLGNRLATMQHWLARFPLQLAEAANAQQRQQYLASKLLGYLYVLEKNNRLWPVN